MPGGHQTLGGGTPPAPTIAAGPPYPTHHDISAALLRTGRLKVEVSPANLTQAICTTLCAERFPHASNSSTRHTLCLRLQPRHRGIPTDTDATTHMSRLASRGPLHSYQAPSRSSGDLVPQTTSPPKAPAPPPALQTNQRPSRPESGTSTPSAKGASRSSGLSTGLATPAPAPSPGQGVPTRQDTPQSPATRFHPSIPQRTAPTAALRQSLASSLQVLLSAGTQPSSAQVADILRRLDNLDPPPESGSHRGRVPSRVTSGAPGPVGGPVGIRGFPNRLWSRRCGRAASSCLQPMLLP